MFLIKDLEPFLCIQYSAETEWQDAVRVCQA